VESNKNTLRELDDQVSSSSFSKQQLLLYQELTWLSAEIQKHDDLYYNSQPEISDDDYDALVQRETFIVQTYPELLQQLEHEHGGKQQATREERIGAKVLSNTRFVVKRHHLRKMLSLDNVHDTKQLMQWLDRVHKKTMILNNNETSLVIRILSEPKLDGLSCSLRYERDDDRTTYTLKWAATRGDGSQGQDVTEAMRRIQALPLQLDKKINTTHLSDRIEVRGEVVFPKTAFEETQLANFSNARNAASGILLRKEDDVETQQLREQLHFLAYDLVTATNEETSIESTNVRDCLEAWGFAVPQPAMETELTINADEPWNVTHVSEILDYYNDLEKHRNGKEASLQWGDYDMDGCVHKVIGSSQRILLGNSNRAPRWAIAHKFPPLTAITGLQAIEVQVGRTGALTPVAILDKTLLNGVTIQRATLHNFQHMQQLFGNSESVPQGTKVFVRRAGDVIPQVVAMVSQEVAKDPSNNLIESIDLSAPKTCPACGSQTVFDPSPTKANDSTENNNNSTDSLTANTGQVLRCGGPPLLCQPRAVQALQHAYSRDALDVQGLSEGKIRQLMNVGYIKLPSDVFVVAKNAERLLELAELSGWGNRSAEVLAESANRVALNGVDLSRFIYSLGIRGVGVHVSSLLAAVYGTVEDFLKDMEVATLPQENGSDDNSTTFARLREETEMTKGIGPTVLQNLESFAKEKILLESAVELAQRIQVIAMPSDASTSTIREGGGPFQGQVVVFTGSLADMTRSEAQTLAKAMGASSTPSTVSRLTNTVVVGAKGGKKQREAEALGIQTLSQDDFFALVKEYNK
jgi:DNA ligase (NAD+)